MIRLQSLNPVHGRDPHSLPLLFQPTGSPDGKTTALPRGRDGHCRPRAPGERCPNIRGGAGKGHFPSSCSSNVSHYYGLVWGMWGFLWLRAVVLAALGWGIIEPALSQRVMNHSRSFYTLNTRYNTLISIFSFFLVGRMVDYFANVLLHLPWSHLCLENKQVLYLLTPSSFPQLRPDFPCRMLVWDPVWGCKFTPSHVYVLLSIQMTETGVTEGCFGRA